VVGVTEGVGVVVFVGVGVGDAVGDGEGVGDDAGSPHPISITMLINKTNAVMSHLFILLYLPVFVFSDGFTAS
jgi:formate hydrogenlyase subunit 3/multisubunit Na+/H+ antiporter MnhD subunit